MLSTICYTIKNYFCDEEDRISGTYEISGGSIVNPPDAIKEGQYIRILGSTYNDGVIQYFRDNNTDDLEDETFTGEIWLMRVPKDFLKLVKEIETYQDSELAQPSVYASESFGGYSYSKPTTSSGSVANDWETVFKARLKPWRKVRP